MTEVFVVMGNDFPDAVFSTAKAAEEYCAQQRKLEQAQKPFARKVYWRVYPFKLDEVA